MSQACLQVALPLPLHQCFDYRPPEGVTADERWIGCRVRVPFGRGEQIGIVSGLGPCPDPSTLKPVLARIDTAPILSGELWQTLRFIARYYHAPLGEALAAALPTDLRAGKPLPETRTEAWQLTPTGLHAFSDLRKGRTRELFQQLLDGPRDAQALTAAMGKTWRAALRTAMSRGWIELTSLDGSPMAPRDASRTPTTEQAEAIARVRGMAGGEVALLDGVTGSGKTEVYLALIRDCLHRGRQAMLLVPEIGLTPQTLRRIRDGLGVPVHALHSGLADGERARAWTAMSRGEGRVLVGTRSAVLCPLPNAGLLIVDEEHDASYKQQDGVRYHARDLAVWRGRSLDVPVLLGSATPALETLRHALSGRYRHLRLRQRATAQPPPMVEKVDLRRRPLLGGLAPETLQALRACVAEGGQALVFRNRRGFAPALLCHDCGWSAACPRCDAPLTVHGGGGRLRCHHCGHRKPRPPACPACGGLALQAQGVGTEQLEATLSAAMPAVPVIRVDRDSTSGRDGLAKQLAKLDNHPGILVGTQMLAKGHDLPGLRLVVIASADEGLFSVDFRAGERLGQLLVQVGGRAGRANRPGRVLLQTHHPDHPWLTVLLGSGYAGFATQLLAEREAAAWPPFGYLALLRAEARTQVAVDAFLQAASRIIGQRPGLQVAGPLPAPMPRRAGYLRGQLLLQATRRPDLQAALNAAMPYVRALMEARKVRWSIDVDPADLG